MSAVLQMDCRKLGRFGRAGLENSPDEGWRRTRLGDSKCFLNASSKMGIIKTKEYYSTPFSLTSLCHYGIKSLSK